MNTNSSFFHEIFKLDNKQQSNIVNIFLVGGIIILIYMLYVLFMEAQSITLWRHDELMHIPSYHWKLISEGRWIIYLCFPFLKIMNPYLAIVIAQISLFYFGYKCAFNFTQHFGFSILLGLSFTFVPSYFSYIGWPLVVIPSFVFLFVLSWLSDKINSRLLIILSALLFHGTLNYFYNMILLLILSQESTKGFRYIFKLLIFWAGCFILGYGSALIAVKVLGGQWGLTIDDWRHATIVHSMNDLYNNINISIDALVNNARVIGFEVILTGLFCWFICLLWNYRKKTESYKQHFLIFILLCSIFFSSYIQEIPYGLYVYVRNAFPFFLSILAISLPLFNLSKILSIIFICIVSCSFYLKDYDSTHYYSTFVKLWSDNIKKMDINPAQIDTIHLCMSMDEFDSQEQRIMGNLNLANPITEYLGSPGRFSTSFEDLGYYGRVLIDHKYCSSLTIPKEHSTPLFEYTSKDHHLYIWLKEGTFTEGN